MGVTTQKKMFSRISQDAGTIQVDASLTLSYGCATCLVLSKHSPQFVSTYYLGILSIYSLLSVSSTRFLLCETKD